MSKFYGKIGFSTPMKETSPGVWEDSIVEKNYYGDMVKKIRKWTSGDGLNDDITISNTLEIVADEYIVKHLTNVRYVVWLGVKWSVSDVSFEFPRMTLSLGGVYNG